MKLGTNGRRTGGRQHKKEKKLFTRKCQHFKVIARNEFECVL